ncbi:DUF4365 domain-containing protein [Saccharothrix obliqua]|uniref:DUF4365 domain-containing protein n=1 Tax=Saccharothrix obliqua TaxID=2861747 RepID=UPI001C5E521D|nr:DUF4365 domain-containing protein [Saccharothrix obliqua]MBW4717206.1 DUF4365 domain-containing protein [Saccharothrix obliqua]
MRRLKSAQVASAGETLVQQAFQRVGWLFRRQDEDFGIDAQVEVVDGEEVLGLLVALQIKSGPSYFREPGDGGWWFRENTAHFTYWLGHSIPVAVVLVDMADEVCYWQLITEATVRRDAGATWKVWVPRTNVVDGSAVTPLREAAEARVRHRSVGVPAGRLGAADLEVHAATSGSGAHAEEPPQYLVRPHDAVLDELVGGALGTPPRSGLAVLVASSGTGKTRALFEALHRPVAVGGTSTSLVASGWRVWPAVNPLPPSRFLDELPLVGPRTVVWLNEAQRYLLDPSAETRTNIATALRELLTDESRGPVLVLGTLWPEFWSSLTRKRPENDEFVAARRLLESGYLRVPEQFTSAEIDAARRSGDRRIAEAAGKAAHFAVTRYLAGAEDLLHRLATAGTAELAVLHAAMDARRLGHDGVLSERFLREAARGYLTDADRARADADPSWFADATADLVRPGKASGPALHRVPFGYRLDDLLDEEGRRSRRFEFPPAGFWSAAAEGDVTPAGRLRLAESAESRMRLRIAVLLYEAAGGEQAGRRLCDIALKFERAGVPRVADRLVKSAVAAGLPSALTSLAMTRAGSDGKEADVRRLLRQAADLGDLEAFDRLASRLELDGESHAAEATAREALALGSWEPTVSVAVFRDIDDPAEAERLVRDLPPEHRSAALTEFVSQLASADGFDSAERTAISAAADGDLSPLLALADHHSDAERPAEARRLLKMVRPKTFEDRMRSAASHARAGQAAKAASLVRQAIEKHSGTPGQLRVFDNLSDRVADFAAKHPQDLSQLAHALREGKEEELARRLFDARDRTPEEPKEPEEQDDDPDYGVDEAYARLATWHAKRREFATAEEFALKAAAFGASGGLLEVGRELLLHGDLDGAERLVMRALNMHDRHSWGNPVTMLAEIRDDGSLPLFGVEADGTTARPR